MPKAHLTRPTKPGKPYPDYPLYSHASGRWAKKIRGQTLFFGPWDDPDGALKKYLEQKDALHAGRKPREASGGVTMKELANAFLNHKATQLEAGDITQRTWDDYRLAAELLVTQFGRGRLVADLGQDDFAKLRSVMSKRWGPVRVKNCMQRVRSLFKYGSESDLLDRPVKYGPGFATPTRKTLRLERAKKGPRMFEAAEVRALIDGATVPGPDGPQLVRANTSVRAMILLGINCGFGNSDCGTLPRSALDLAGGWVNFPRPKTGINRRCALWPETVAAIRDAMAERVEPADGSGDGLVFTTARGGNWNKDTSDAPLSKEMRKLIDAFGLKGNKNFYALRHTFETIGGEAKDQVAVDHVMGHTRDDMASVYRERISDERLKAVSDHVRKWVFGGEV